MIGGGITWFLALDKYRTADLVVGSVFQSSRVRICDCVLTIGALFGGNSGFYSSEILNTL